MKLFKKLKAYKPEEAEDARIGFGAIRAKDYNKNKFGHLFLFSINFYKLKGIYKLFLTI
jgi:hypothetical protein